jgi:hypothetical protein
MQWVLTAVALIAVGAALYFFGRGREIQARRRASW